MKRILTVLMTLLLCASASAEDAALSDDGTLRVALTSLGNPASLTLTLHGEYAAGNDVLLAENAAVTLFEQDSEIRLTAGGLTLRLGETVTLSRRNDDAGLIIAESEKPNLYMGDLTVTAKDGGLHPVLTIHVEDYLKGVVAYEMSNSFPLEALKAQAVAARTYAMSCKQSASGRDYDVTDTASDQVFKGYDPQYTRVAEAVDETRGVVGLDGDAFAECYYTASNGGQVARPSDVWGGGSDMIRLKDDPYDLENPRSLVNSITFQADASDCAALKRMIEAQLGAFERILSITPGDPDPADSRRYTTLSVRAETADGEQTATLDVYSDIKDGLSLGLNGGDYELITVSQTGSAFTLEMRRFGHGAGMSQRGAQRMAEACGMGWEEILAFYYPGMTLTKIDWDAARETAIVTLSCGDSALNLREAPSADARILARLRDGQRVTLTGEAEDGWTPVRAAGMQGYVKTEFLTEEN